ncbi:MAG: DUF1343 domain-containing protein [Bacteroidales bacterium]|nr:DUF1343 domain-containing protein [Bacteroidales bacterium]MCF8334764.1 DUF1343 domain-containing protein [Bacteroidales bacterium]
MRKYQFVLILIAVVFFKILPLQGQNQYSNDITPAAERIWIYLPFVGDKPFAVVANHTSKIGDTHLVDTLVSMNYNLKKIFSPEHGFRGKADAGTYLYNSTDTVTGLPVISLYGDNRKPKPRQLEDVEIVVFDLQDVGARFYTYFSTLTYVMEACAETNTRLIILDRPNPNGFYVDGPMLKPSHKSFVGMHPIPVVHGMTAAEYAHMVNDEGWINGDCDLIWVLAENYTHEKYYKLPVKPSPNLPDMASVYLYPSLCFFEGTSVSVGRGTEHPFSIYGHPQLDYGDYTFVPQPGEGSQHPKQQGKVCRGEKLTNYGRNFQNKPHQLHLDWLIKAYHSLKEKDKFFNSYFDKLAGSTQLRQQIEKGMTAAQIRKTWEDDLKEFRQLRKKYLLYPDFK